MSKSARWMLWAAVFAGLLSPALLLLERIASQSLGPDPAQALMHSTGEWVLRILVLVLLARPLAQYGYPFLFRFRRMLGNFAFFYASLHLLVFAQVYIGWSGEILAEELVERPYVLVGFAAWLLMLPLAVTSTNSMRRRLGRNWKRLHRAVYAVVVLGTLHLLWLSRSDIGEALVYGALFAALLGWRAKRPLQQRFLKGLPPNPEVGYAARPASECALSEAQTSNLRFGKTSQRSTCTTPKDA